MGSTDTSLTKLDGMPRRASHRRRRGTTHASRARRFRQRDDMGAARRLTHPSRAGYSRRMRFSDRKLESLAEKMMRWIESQPDVQLLEPRDRVRDALVAELQAERDVERKLDEEVEKILEQNESRMRSEGVDPWVMRKKVRQQLARDRGIVL